jgi:hypothetical protein
MVIRKPKVESDRWDFSAPCAFCGKPDPSPAYCPECGSSFCDDHREPYKHNCRAFTIDYNRYKSATKVNSKKFSNAQIGYMVLFLAIFIGAFIILYRSYNLGLI